MSWVEKFIQHCWGLVRLFTIGFQWFLLDRKHCRNRRDHGSLSQNGPQIFSDSLLTFRKKHFYTWCAGLIVHALLTIYRQCVAVGAGWGVLSCVVDHILHEFNTLFLTRSEPTKFLHHPKQKWPVKTTLRERCLYSSFIRGECSLLQGGSDTDAVDTEGEQEEDLGQGASRASTSVTVLPKVIQSVLPTLGKICHRKISATGEKIWLLVTLP